MMFLVNFPKVQQQQFFRKKHGYYNQKVKKDQTADTYQKLLQQKTMVLWKILLMFELFSGEKCAYIDVHVLMIQSTIKPNQTDQDVCPFKK